MVGTPDHVAGLVQEVMQEVGGDGFLLFNAHFDRRYVMEICDGLVPELQRRGLTRKAYAHKALSRQSDGVLNAYPAAVEFRLAYRWISNWWSFSADSGEPISDSAAADTARRSQSVP